jgi:hypothetical protein
MRLSSNENADGVATSQIHVSASNRRRSPYCSYRAGYQAGFQAESTKPRPAKPSVMTPPVSFGRSATGPSSLRPSAAAVAVSRRAVRTAGSSTNSVRPNNCRGPSFASIRASRWTVVRPTTTPASSRTTYMSTPLRYQRSIVGRGTGT